MAQALQQDTNTEIFPEGLSMQHVVNEDLLFRRHKRLRNLPELTYEFTKDPALLQQYYMLRSLVFERSYGVSIEPEADVYDDESHILIARAGNQVVGGVRMTFKLPGNNSKISLSKYHIDIEAALPELNLGANGYCEAARMAVLEEYQATDITRKLMEIMFKHSHSLGIKHAFSMVPTAVYRLHRITCKKLGYKYELLDHVTLPSDVDGVDGKSFKLMLFDVGNSIKSPKIQKASTAEFTT